MAKVKVNLGKASYEIEIRRGLLEEVGERIKTITPKAEKVAVITDDNVSAIYGARFKKILEKSGFLDDLGDTIRWERA